MFSVFVNVFQFSFEIYNNLGTLALAKELILEEILRFSIFPR